MNERQPISKYEQVRHDTDLVHRALTEIEREYDARCEQIQEELGRRVQAVLGGFIVENESLFSTDVLHFGNRNLSVHTRTGQITNGDEVNPEVFNREWYIRRNTILTALEHELMREKNS